MQTSPKHYYMAAALLTYVVEEDRGVQKVLVPKQRHMNVVLELNRKAITASDFNEARMALQQRLANEATEAFRGVRDTVFLSLNYLGLMKPEDFYDTQAPDTTAPKH